MIMTFIIIYLIIEITITFFSMILCFDAYKQVVREMIEPYRFKLKVNGIDTPLAKNILAIVIYTMTCIILIFTWPHAIVNVYRKHR